MGIWTRRDNKRNKTIIGLGWFTLQLHIDFHGRAISFSQITTFTRYNHIGPIGFTTSRLRHNMINRQRVVGATTVLAGVIIAAQYVFPAELNAIFMVAMNHFQHPNHSWNRKTCSGRSNAIIRIIQFFGSTTKNHNQSMAGTAKLQRLIGIV